MNPFLEAAKAYLRAGFSPFPCEISGKRPITAWRQYADTPPTVEQLERWWADTPRANIGLALRRGQWVLDVDSDEGFAAVEATGHRLVGAHVSTGKGWHFYFKGDAPNGVAVLSGVDTRGYGGFVVCPPSVHESGRRYTGTPYLSEPSPALLGILSAQRSAPRQQGPAGDDPILAWANGIAEGGRDIACTRAAGKLLGLGLHPDAVEALLLPGAERCSPPFEDVAKCVASIAKKEDVGDRRGPPADIKVAVAEAMAEINTPRELRRLQGTEFTKLDEYLSGGFEPGEFAVNGAPPGTGKTAFLLQVARKKAEDGVGVLFITREMRRAALVRRWLVQVSGVRMSDVKSGQLVDQQRASLRWAADHLAALPIWISGSSRVEDVRAAMAQFEPGQIGIVFVDYLQLMRGPQGERRLEVDDVCQALKDMAIDFSVPVVANSSLRRLAKMKDGSREKPDMFDLRESGAIEFGADIVTIMQRQFDSDLCDLVVNKNRDGRTGTIKMRFQGDLMKFSELSS